MAAHASAIRDADHAVFTLLEDACGVWYVTRRRPLALETAPDFYRLRRWAYDDASKARNAFERLVASENVQRLEEYEHPMIGKLFLTDDARESRPGVEAD